MSNGKAHDFDRTYLIELRMDPERIRIRFVRVREHARFWTRNRTMNGRRKDDSRTTFATKGIWSTTTKTGTSMPTMPRKTETRATKSQSTKRMWSNANNPPKNTNDRPNRTTNHDGSNSNWETPSIAQRRSLASATKRLATIKWYQMGITNVQGCKGPRVLTRKLNLNLKHNPYWMCWTFLDLKNLVHQAISS